MKSIKKNFQKIDHLIYLEPHRLKKSYITIISVVIAGLISYLYAFNKQSKVIDLQEVKITLLENDTTKLGRLLGEYSIDIEAYTNIVKDKDYLRYIAFKHSDIMIPANVPTEDLIIINRQCELYSIPQKYIWRLIHTESRFNPNAKSPVGAKGYMQIMPATYNSLLSKYLAENGENSLDSYNSNQINLILGTYYLYRLYNTYNNWELALAAYNAGPGNVNAAGRKVPEFQETQNYVKTIQAIDNK